MRGDRSPSVLKPLSSASVLTSPVLNTREVYPLLEVSPNAELSNFRTESFALPRIKWVKPTWLKQKKPSRGTASCGWMELVGGAGSRPSCVDSRDHTTQLGDRNRQYQTGERVPVHVRTDAASQEDGCQE